MRENLSESTRLSVCAETKVTFSILAQLEEISKLASFWNRKSIDLVTTLRGHSWLSIRIWSAFYLEYNTYLH